MTHPDGSTRAEVLDAISQWLAASATITPLLLVLEDLHWSTSTTRDALRHVMRRSRRAPLLIIATTRDSKPDLDAGLGALLAELDRSPAVRRVTLEGLDRDAVAQLVGDGSHDAREVLAETHGNPLLVTHLTAQIGGDPLPGWLHQRDQLLDDATRELLDQAATFGNEFDARLLAAAVEAPLLDVLALLEAAEAAGLVVPRPGTASGFAFVHALFRSVRYRELTVRRRLLLHARAAAAWRSATPTSGHCRSEPAMPAWPCPVVDPREAVTLALGAARFDERAYAYDETIAHLGRALDAAQLIEPSDPAVTLDLEVGIAAARHHRGDPEGLPLLLDAARRADARGDRHALVRAATAIPQFGAVGFLDPMAEGRAVTEAALAVVGDESSAARAQLLMDLSSHWLFVDVDEALDLARRAEAVARDLDDPEVLGNVLLAARHVLSHPGAHRRTRPRRRRARPARSPPRSAAVPARRGRRRWRRHTSNGASWRRGPTASSGSRSCSATGTSGSSACRRSTIPPTARSSPATWRPLEELVELTVPWSVGIGAGRVFAEVDDRRQPSAAGPRRRGAAAGSSAPRSAPTDGWYRCSLAAVQARSGDAAAARDDAGAAARARTTRSARSIRGRSP